MRIPSAFVAFVALRVGAAGAEETRTLIGPGREGGAGLDTVQAADTGTEGTARLKLTLAWFDVSDFPRDGQSDTFSGATLAGAFTPWGPLEVFLSTRVTSNANDGTRPGLLQTQGDLALGLKGAYALTPLVALGAAASGHLTSALGDGGFDADATSYWLRLLFMLDGQRATGLPLRLMLDAGYYFENGDKAAAGRDEALDLVQEFGLQLARYDRITLGLGLESPFSQWVTAFLEYRLDTPLEVDLTKRERLDDDFDFASIPHTLAPGVRVTPLPGLALDASVRVGLSDNPYLGVPATPPWQIVLAAAYTIDPSPAAVAHADDAQTAPPAPASGGIAGRVVSAKTGEIVPEARVEYPGTPRNAQLTDASGRFTSYDLPPGKARLRVVARGFTPRDVDADLVAGPPLALDVRLEPDAAAATGELSVQVTDEDGKALLADVRIDGEPPVSGRVPADGPFKAVVALGKRQVTASAEGLASRTLEVDVKAGEPATLRIALGKGSATQLVVIRARRLELRRQVRFGDGSARILKGSESLLDEVAEVLRGNPQIKKIRIEGHTDDRGDAARNKRLSDARAQAVSAALVTRGISAERLSARGYGSERPVAPNVSKRGREKNRRVELVIVEGGP